MPKARALNHSASLEQPCITEGIRVLRILWNSVQFRDIEFRDFVFLQKRETSNVDTLGREGVAMGVADHGPAEADPQRSAARLMPRIGSQILGFY